ncbi:MAG: hypothetical protein IT435_08250 [Phycisphaerales bacterium]|nr:hypothetical protein [Phycisphaerales bacterium]
MKTTAGRMAIGAVLASVCGFAAPALAEQNVTVDPGQTWLGFMNVFELPSNGGGYVFGSPWGTGDLAASFAGDGLTLSPNTNTYNPNDPFWVQPNGEGNKWMNANMYVEQGNWDGETVNFRGHTLVNSFVDGYTSLAFIKVLDPSQGWATIASTTIPLFAGQDFELSMNVPTIPGVVTQYGFETNGANANPVGVDRLGHVEVTAIPGPAGAGLMAIAGLVIGRHRR